MNKMLSVITAIIMLFSFFAPEISSAHAATTTNIVKSVPNGTTPIAVSNSQDFSSQLDQYVTVKNNKFVLNIPKGISIDQTTLNEAKKAINESNKNVNQNNLVIDPVTKTASKVAGAGNIVPMSAGTNKVEFYWWGIRVYLSARTIQIASTFSLGAAAYIASTLEVTLVVGAAIAGALAALGLLVSWISNGYVVDYNYALGVTRVAQQ